MGPDFVTAKTWQNNVTWERQIGTDYALSLGLRQSRGWNLPVINNVNLVGITPVRYLEDGRGVYDRVMDPEQYRGRSVDQVLDMTVLDGSTLNPDDYDLVFTAVESDAAKEIEKAVGPDVPADYDAMSAVLDMGKDALRAARRKAEGLSPYPAPRAGKRSSKPRSRPESSRGLQQEGNGSVEDMATESSYLM